MMIKNKPSRTLAEIIVRHNEIVLVANDTEFLFTEEMIESHLSEGWMEDESVICSVGDQQIELYNRDYREMQRALHPFGR